MQTLSIDISGRIDPERVSILSNIQEVAIGLDIRFFVVGAFARDVIFEHMHRIPAPRITGDIDIGVEVANWAEFQLLTRTLIDRGILRATKLPHRFIGDASVTIVDIIPFGEISGEGKRISWPPDHDTIMNMLGFEEAYQSAMKVHLSSEPPLDILVPSIPALALMKIISWADAYPRRERDAQDLLFILENYDATGIEAKLYESHSVMLIDEEFDARLAAIRLLGQDIAVMSSPETVKTVENILIRETDADQGFKMLADMTKRDMPRGTRFETVWRLLDKLRQGIHEGQTVGQGKKTGFTSPSRP